MNQWLSHQTLIKGPVTPGGICAIYAAPVEWIHSFPSFDPTTQYLQGDILLGYQKYWIRINVAASGKNFTESSKRMNGRAYWEQKLTMKMFWQSGQQDVRLSNMANSRWVFLMRESGTGIYYVIGKPSSGAELAIEYASGPGTATTLEVTFRSIHRAPLYTGVNRAICRVIDENGDFIVDADGNYLAFPCDMITAPSGSEADFSNAEFTGSDFYVPNV